LPIRRAAMSARREAMRETNMKKAISMSKLLPVVMLALALLSAATAHAAAPGITGTGGAGTFNLTARTAYLTQPDGQSIYSWGYGCTTSAATFAPAAIAAPSGGCAAMQVPGPTLIVTEGQPFSVALTTILPTSLASRRAHTPITAERKAIYRSRWASTERSLCSQAASPPSAPPGYMLPT